MYGTGTRNMVMLLAVLLIAAVLLPTLGCGGPENTSSQGGWIERMEEAAPEEELEEPVGTGENTAAAGAGVVHMCGRSVLGAWFNYWGWDADPENPVHFGGYTLVYHEMDCPPGIVQTAREVAREVAGEGGGIMFFKLCFADFVGGDEDGARENLDNNREIIREVVKAAVEDGALTLILGNALPMVREYTDSWLVWNHRQYNRFLEELAGEHGGRVLVLDLYGTLAAPDGWLRPGYAADPSDSHLNDSAYAALDKVLGKTMEKLASSP